MRANTFGGVLGCAAAVLIPLFADAAPLDSTVQELHRRVEEQEAIIRGPRRELDALAKQVDGSIRPRAPRRRPRPVRHRPKQALRPQRPPRPRRSASLQRRGR